MKVHSDHEPRVQANPIHVNTKSVFQLSMLSYVSLCIQRYGVGNSLPKAGCSCTQSQALDLSISQQAFADNVLRQPPATAVADERNLPASFSHDVVHSCDKITR